MKHKTGDMLPKRLFLVCAILVVTAMVPYSLLNVAQASDGWGPYQPVTDGKDDRIHVRVKIGTFRYDGGNYKMTCTRWA